MSSKIELEKQLILEMIDNGDVSYEGIIEVLIVLCDARRVRLKDLTTDPGAQAAYSKISAQLERLKLSEIAGKMPVDEGN